VVASATFTDPSPVEGKGFTVFIRNGTGTVGGTGYSVAGTEIRRLFHSGSWANYTGGGAISGLTSGRVVVATSGTTIGDDANLFWDGANKRLDLRTASGIRFQRNDNALNFEMGLIDTIATNDFVINAVTSPTGFQFQQGGVTVFGITNQQRFNFNNKIFFNTSTGSALADFQSTNQGLVLPRALRSAIISSENGMLTVDTNVPYFNNGTAWSAIPTAPTALGTSLQVLRTNAGGTATEWATISGGGISNTAATNEIPKSNGTNIVPSGIFTTTSGIITTGTWNGTAIDPNYGGTGLTGLGLPLQQIRVNGAGTAFEYFSPPAGTSLSALTGGASNNSIDNGGTHTWSWNSLTNTKGFLISSNSANASVNAQRLFNVELSGANFNSSEITYAASVSNTHTGTSSTNIALNLSASGGTVNRALNIDAGEIALAGSAGTSGQVLTSQGANSTPIWSSAGGTYYAPSTLVSNATDANFTATANGVHNILDGVASANRVITIPTGANGDVMKFYNTEDTRVWSFTGETVYLADRVTVVTELLYNVPCHMERIDGRWIITN
jgi:hypothetical protein